MLWLLRLPWRQLSPIQIAPILRADKELDYPASLWHTTEIGILFGRQGLPDWVIASSAGIWFHASFGGGLGGKPSVHEWQKRESQQKCDEAGVLSCFPVRRQPAQDRNTWEVAVHEPAGRLYLLRVA